MKFIQIIAGAIIMAGIIYLLRWSLSAVYNQIKQGSSCCGGQPYKPEQCRTKSNILDRNQSD